MPNFSLSESTQTFSVDVEDNRVVHGLAQQQASYKLNLVDGHFNEQDLIRCLEREVRQPDISPQELQAWLTRLLGHLTQEQGHSLTALERTKFILARAVLKRIAILREQAASNGFQQLLFGTPDKLETSFEYNYPFSANAYPAHNYYRGRFQFKRHFYPIIGDLKAEGEEFECATIN